MTEQNWSESESHSVMSDSLWPHGLYSPWNSPGQNTGVGSLSLLQGIFPTQGSNPGLLHCRWVLYQVSHQENPRILEWVAYPFSSSSSWPRNQTTVSFTAGRFFTNWAMREALTEQKETLILCASAGPLMGRASETCPHSALPSKHLPGSQARLEVWVWDLICWLYLRTEMMTCEAPPKIDCRGERREVLVEEGTWATQCCGR